MEYNSRSQPLPFSEARKILQSIIPSFSRLFIVVDALDETDQYLYDKLLLEMFHLQRIYGANIFATSRHIPDIERRFEGAKKLEIRANDEDVCNYVDSYMARLPRFVARSPELQQETRTGIVKAIDGMFLLAILHLDSLIGARSVRAFRDALGSLPTGTNAYKHAYGFALDRIESQVQNRRDLAIEVLSWVVCARRHLKTYELRHALAVIVGSTHFDESNIPDINDMISVCAGLVVVDPGRDIVRLVHYTAQEYFEREKKERLPNAQGHLTTICLAYLSLDCFQDGSVRVTRGSWRNTFHYYARANWGHHARETVALLPAVLEFLACEEEIERQGRFLTILNSDRWALSTEVRTGITGLHVAAYFGILEAVQLLGNETCIDLKDNFGGTPLSWASLNGQAKVVAHLLDTGKVRTDSADSRSRTPLHLAATRGHRAVTELLLTRGHVDVNARDESRDTPLCIAVSEGHVTTAEVLLNHGADLDRIGRSYKSPAKVAIEKDDVVIIKLLIEKREIELDKRLLLTEAAFKGSLAVTRFLIDECKVDVNSKGDDGQTALPIALGMRNWEVARFLLINDQVDLTPKDSTGNSLFHLAVKTCNMQVLEFLLAKDEVDPNSRDDEGRSPLSYAVASGQPEMVQILVKAKNIDINCTNKRGQTPLLEVARVLSRLTEDVNYNRAEISKRDQDCPLCINWAADETQQNRIDYNMAKIEKYKSIFNLLVDKGAGHGVEDDDGNTIESYQQRERDLWESYQAKVRKTQKETGQRHSTSGYPCSLITLHSEQPGPSFSSLLW